MFQTYGQHVMCSVIRKDIQLCVLSVFICTTPIVAVLKSCNFLKHTCFPLHRKQYTVLQNMTHTKAICTSDRFSTVPERKTAFTIRNATTTKRYSFFIGLVFNAIQKSTIKILLKHDWLPDGSNLNYNVTRLRTGHTGSV